MCINRPNQAEPYTEMTQCVIFDDEMDGINRTHWLLHEEKERENDRVPPFEQYCNLWALFTTQLATVRKRNMPVEMADGTRAIPRIYMQLKPADGSAVSAAKEAELKEYQAFHISAWDSIVVTIEALCANEYVKRRLPNADWSRPFNPKKEQRDAGIYFIAQKEDLFYIRDEEMAPSTVVVPPSMETRRAQEHYKEILYGMIME